MVEQSGSSTEETQSATIGHVSTQKSLQNRKISPKIDNKQEIPNIGNNDTISHRFSIFRWFKRSGVTEKTPNQSISENKSVYSSSESVNTFYSTATVKSFAFHSPEVLNSLNGPIPLDLLNHHHDQIGPFGSGAAKIVGNKTLDVTRTLPADVLSKKRNLTSRYSLQNCAGSFGSCNNIGETDVNNKEVLRRFDGTRGKRVHVRGKRKAPNPPISKSRPRSFCSVEGINGADSIEAVERNLGSISKRKQRRPAPQPPSLRVKTVEEEEEGMENCRIETKAVRNSKNVFQGQVQLNDEAANNNKSKKITNTIFKFDENRQSLPTIDNDTLVLQGGFLQPKKESLAMPNISELQNPSAVPRPWYKRNVFENSMKKIDHSKGVFQTREETVGNNSNYPLPALEPPISMSGSSRQAEKSRNDSPNSMTKLSFFKNFEDKRKDTKRRSGLSILTNISELDKEAAAIVQEEQAKTKAIFLQQSWRVDESEKRKEENQEVIQDIVASSIESSPRRGTRALISKFNAIGNITKVTVNSNFFTKNSSSNSKNLEKNKDEEKDPKNKISQGNLEPDLTKYFPQKNNQPSPKNIRSINESRRSFLQSTINFTTKSDESVNKNVTMEPEKLISDVTNRLSLLQNVISRSSRQQKIASPVFKRSPKTMDITSSVSPTADNSTKIFNYESSPIVYRATRDGVFNRTETVQKEFSDIFEEIDNQSDVDQKAKKNDLTSEVKMSQNIKTRQELEAANKVSKVLDILVEAEKELKNNDEKKMKTPLINDSTDQITTDLKEMLKEMKHSLPKRPKPRRGIDLASKSSKVDVSTSYLLNSVKIANPPIPQMGPSTSSESSTSSVSKGGMEERQKVSSSVQTSGNVRRVISSTSSGSQTSLTSHQWKNDDVIYRTSGRSQTRGSGLVKNTFQLMRPREFAAIKAIKTLKNTEDDNTYANVMEQSLYANALVLPSRNHRVIANDFITNETGKKKIPVPDEKIHDDKFSTNSAELCDEQVDPIVQNMNTLAVNRLLKKLEASIASGNHQQAAGLAKELARLKIQCSVIRQRRKTGDLINLDMYIEDRLAHQGPIPLQLPLIMSVKQLKEKIFNEFEIPANVQRWIIGKTLANDDNATLDDLKAIDGSPIFLYLVAPDLQITNGVKLVSKEIKINNTHNKGIDVPTIKNTKEVTDNHNDKITNNNNNQRVEEKQHLLNINNEEQNYPIPVLELMEHRKRANLEIKNDWKHEVIEEKEVKKQKSGENDTNADGATSSLKLKDTKQYTQLIMLENCEIVSNVDTIECPICFIIYGPLEGVVLRDCLHSFCRICIENTIKYCNEAEVKCPYRDSEYTCESTLQEREIKALVKPEIYEQHLAKSVAQAENNAGHNAFHCKTPDCPGWCIYDDNVNNFLCPVCNRNNCLTCRVIHEGKNCFEYQEDVRISKETDQESKRTAAMLSEMLRRGEAMACPTCDVVLMKKMGCDWLRCSMCKTEICWVTKGPRWGPGGSGDTSGGCRCGQNGVKCHPCCNYCH